MAPAPAGCSAAVSPVTCEFPAKPYVGLVASSAHAGNASAAFGTATKIAPIAAQNAKLRYLIALLLSKFRQKPSWTNPRGTLLWTAVWCVFACTLVHIFSHVNSVYLALVSLGV